MLRVATGIGAAVLLAMLGGCSGKTERGSGSAAGDAGPVQKPAAGPGNVESARATPARHLLMVVELEPATHAARTLTTRTVDLPLPARRGPVRPRPWRVDVIDSSGSVLFSAPLDDAAALRGELVDANGQLSGVTGHKRFAAVTLRLPWLNAASEVRVVSVSDTGDTELGRVAYPKVAP